MEPIPRLRVKNAWFMAPTITLPVIFERVENGFARGWSDNYIEVTVPADGVTLGRITRVQAAAANLGGTAGGAE